MGAFAPADGERDPTTIAFLALAYAELSRCWSSVGPWLDGAEVWDDLEQEDDQLSLLTLAASQLLVDDDWLIVRWLGRNAVGTADEERGFSARDFELVGRRLESFRLEGLLHAVAAGEERGSRTRAKELAIPAAFAVRVAERWHEVEAEIERLRGLGVAATREEVDDVWREAVGRAS